VQTVPIDDVLYLLAEQKYVTVRHSAGRMLIDESLKALEQEFPDRFMRIHRNALVATRQLVGLEKGADGASLAVLSGCEERLPVSRRHLPEIRRFSAPRLSRTRAGRRLGMPKCTFPSLSLHQHR
jgi:two-component system response regulator AlgR